jgi:hypothetical protein
MEKWQVNVSHYHPAVLNTLAAVDASGQEVSGFLLASLSLDQQTTSVRLPPDKRLLW